MILKLNKAYSFKAIIPDSSIDSPDQLRIERADNFLSLDRAMNQLLAAFENSGYPFVQISSNKQIVEDTLSVFITMDKGNLIVYDSIVVQPEAIIQKSYIQQYLAIKKNKAYSQKDISEVENKLNRLPFLSSKAPPKVFFYDNSADVYLFISKRKASQFDALLGFQQEGRTQKNTFTGEVNLNLKNAFSRGEIVRFHFNSIQGGALNLESSIAVPFLLNTPIGVGLELAIFKQDSSFIQTYRGIQLQILNNGLSNIELFANSNSSSRLSAKELDYTNYQKLLYGIQGKYNSTNDFYFPNRGLLAEAKFALGTGRSNQAIIKRIEYTQNLQYFVGIAKKLVIAQSVRTSAIIGPLISKNEQLRLGGFSTLRGFNEREFYANNHQIISNEVRYAFDKPSYIFLFSDVANTNIDTKFSKERLELLRAFGAGVSLKLSTGNFIFSYAIGAQQNNPLVLQSGKVHFGFTSVF